MHGDKRRAEAFQAGIILVAARLVDPALAAELGFQRLDRHAVRLQTAIAAAFAHQLVDDDALVGIGIKPALAAAAFLRSAGLVVDQHRDAGDGGELGLHLHQIVAMMDGDAARPVLVLGIFLRIVGDHHHARSGFAHHLLGDQRHGELAVVGLAAGHGDRVVEQDLVGDVDAGGDRGADRQAARVVIGAVADILENVIARGEQRLAHPVRALATHMGEAERLAVHPLRHIVTADAGIGARTFGNDGGRVMRTAGAEIGAAVGDLFGFAQALAHLL